MLPTKASRCQPPIPSPALLTNPHQGTLPDRQKFRWSSNLQKDFTLRDNGSRRAGEIAPQRILPFRHVDVVGVQAVRRQNGISRASRRAREFGRGHGLDFGRQSGRAHDFGGKLIPCAVAGIGDMHDPARGRAAKFDQCRRQIARVGRAAPLDRSRTGNLRTRRRQLQNGCGKTFASVAEQPRCPRDANVGQNLEQPFLGPRLALAINAGRIPRIAGLVRRAFLPSKT